MLTHTNKDHYCSLILPYTKSYSYSPQFTHASPPALSGLIRKQIIIHLHYSDLEYSVPITPVGNIPSPLLLPVGNIRSSLLLSGIFRPRYSCREYSVLVTPVANIPSKLLLWGIFRPNYSCRE